MNPSEVIGFEKNINEEIKNLSKEFFFDVCKITRPTLDKKIQNNLKKYISNDYHGEMSWMKSMIKDMAIALSKPRPYNSKI